MNNGKKAKEMQYPFLLETLIAKGFCTGCGTCIAACPSDALLLRRNQELGVFEPEIDRKTCKKCGLCMRVCPQLDSARHTNASYGFGTIEDHLIGNYIDLHIGYANDDVIRYRSTSGGLVTQLLLFALDKGIINGALVTKMNNYDNSLSPEPFIARTKEEILEASQSKYCPVPANVALKQLLQLPECDKIAVVGLPCHLNGIRKAEENSERLKKRIVLHLGLFCSHSFSFKGLEFLCHRYDITIQDIDTIHFRGNGWPGSIEIQCKDGNRISFQNNEPLWNSIFNALYFAPKCCLFCDDLTAEASDLSFGDAWIPEVMQNETEGMSIVIARTSEGKMLLDAAASNRWICLLPTSRSDVVKSQRLFLHFKKVNLYYRLVISNLIGNKPLKNYFFHIRGVRSNYLTALIVMVHQGAGLKLSTLLQNLPRSIFCRYSFLIRIMMSVIARRDFDQMENRV